MSLYSEKRIENTEKRIETIGAKETLWKNPRALMLLLCANITSEYTG